MKMNGFLHFQQLHYKHQLSKEQKTISDELRNKEYSKNLLNELDREITSDELKQAANKIKSKKLPIPTKLTMK